MTEQNAVYDVAVIGAGVIGGMIARELSKYKLRICVLEREHDVAMGATRANSAIVHAGFDAAEGSLKAKLNVAGSEQMETLAAELGVKYQRNGSLVIGFDEADEKTIAALYARGVKNGVKGLQILDQEGVRALEPNLSERVRCALYAPTGAIVCPYELAIASIGNAMDNGAELRLGFEVTEIEKTDGLYAIASKDDKIHARVVVNAAGLYADAIAKLAGDDSFAIHPRRGEYVLLDRECGELVRHTIFRTPSKMGKGILVSPTVDGNLLLGPTSVDGSDKEDKAVTADGLERIMREALENVPAIPNSKVITSFCGLRAVGDSGDFIIRAAKDGFIHAAGIESPGLSASPAIAAYVAELVGTMLPLEENPSFQPCREAAHTFREADMETKNAWIKKNPAYGRIVCRCEGITEGEILDALRTNPKARDLDGVKRRTRAQMGRCQGGFCSPHIVELIAEELKIPIEQVTKCGGGSYIHSGKTKEVERRD